MYYGIQFGINIRQNTLECNYLVGIFVMNDFQCIFTKKKKQKNNSEIELYCHYFFVWIFCVAEMEKHPNSFPSKENRI